MEKNTKFVKNVLANLPKEVFFLEPYIIFSKNTLTKKI